MPNVPEADRCTLERLREQRTEMRFLVNDLKRLACPYPEDGCRHYGSLAAAVHHAEQALENVETMVSAYSEAVEYGEVEEEACT